MSNNKQYKLNPNFLHTKKNIYTQIYTQIYITMINIDYMVPMANIATPLFQGIDFNVLTRFHTLLSENSDYKNWYNQNYHVLKNLSNEYIKKTIHTYCTEEISTYVQDLYAKSMIPPATTTLPTTLPTTIQVKGGTTTNQVKGGTTTIQVNGGTTNIQVKGGTTTNQVKGGTTNMASISIFIVSIIIYLFSTTNNIHEHEHGQPQPSKINTQVAGVPPAESSIPLSMTNLPEALPKTSHTNTISRLIYLIGIASKKYIIKITLYANDFLSEIAIYKELNNTSNTKLKNNIINLYFDDILQKDAENMIIKINDEQYITTNTTYPQIFDAINKMGTEQKLYFVLEYDPENIVLEQYLNIPSEQQFTCDIILNVLETLVNLNNMYKFCHMDLHHKNLLVNKSNHQIKFYDFDMSFTENVDNLEFYNRMSTMYMSNRDCRKVLDNFKNTKYNTGFCYDIFMFLTNFNVDLIKQCTLSVENDDKKDFLEYLIDIHDILMTNQKSILKKLNLPTSDKSASELWPIIMLKMTQDIGGRYCSDIKAFFNQTSKGGTQFFYNKYKKYKIKYFNLKRSNIY